MARYNFDLLKQLWIDNGGNPARAGMAAAVALAESGGDPTAVSRVNPNGTQDQGLWQISRHGVDPSLQDPAQNARIAIQMSNNGENWRPWCTAYSDGACGTKGGSYLGSSAPFWKFLTGTGTTVPSSSGYPTVEQSNRPDPNASDSDCLWKLKVGPVGGCVLDRGQGRALLGGVLIGAGSVVIVVGIALLLGVAKSDVLTGERGRQRLAEDRRQEQEQRRQEVRDMELLAREKSAQNRIESADRKLVNRRRGPAKSYRPAARPPNTPDFDTEDF